MLKPFLSREIGTMVHGHPKPRLIFERCLDILVQNHIQLPSSRGLTDLVRTGLNQHKTGLSKLVETKLSDKTRKQLEDLFTQSVTDQGDAIQPLNARYKLTLLKRISQSARPTKIREHIHDFELLKNLYQNLMPVLSVMNLTDDGIRYYAGSVLKSKIFQMTRRSDEDCYLHAIAFIAHQYYRLQDNLVDVLLGAVQTPENTAKREHKEQVYNQRKAQETAIYSLLERINDDFDMLGKIKELAHDGQLDDSQIVEQIRKILSGDKESELAEMKVELETILQGEAYYDVLENRSVRLQNKVSPILKALSFKAQSGCSLPSGSHRSFQGTKMVILPRRRHLIF